MFFVLSTLELFLAREIFSPRIYANVRSKLCDAGLQDHNYSLLQRAIVSQASLSQNLLVREVLPGFT